MLSKVMTGWSQFTFAARLGPKTNHPGFRSGTEEVFSMKDRSVSNVPPCYQHTRSSFGQFVLGCRQKR